MIRKHYYEEEMGLKLHRCVRGKVQQQMGLWFLLKYEKTSDERLEHWVDCFKEVVKQA